MHGHFPLIEKYSGTLLVSCVCDAKALYFTCVVVVESKNGDTETWFLVQLRDGIVDVESKVVIISNRQIRLVDVVSFMFPSAQYSYCLRNGHRICTGGKR